LRIIEYSKQFGLKKPVFSHIQSAFVIKFLKNIEGINEGIKHLYELIKENQGKNTSDLAKLMNKSPKTLERWLSELKKQGKIIFKGSKKTEGYYCIN